MNRPVLHWVGKDLYAGLSLTPVAALYVTERRKSDYYVVNKLPGGDDVDDIRGIKRAREAAEQVVLKWFDEVMTDSKQL